MSAANGLRRPVRLVLGLALMLGLLGSASPVVAPSSASSAEAVGRQRIFNSKWSDQPLQVSRLFRGGSPSTRGRVPIGKESGFHPTRSYYNPAGCRAFVAKGFLIWDKEDRTGWHNIGMPTGKWTIELQCGKGQGSW